MAMIIGDSGSAARAQQAVTEGQMGAQSPQMLEMPWTRNAGTLALLSLAAASPASTKGLRD
jgi:hypothetical protein